MSSEIEQKKNLLEQERRISPLKPYWIKKDFIQPCEAILIYYQIEPTVGQLPHRNIQIIQAIDYLGIYDVLMSSKFIMNSGPYIELIDFIEWATDKGFNIPEHLLPPSKTPNPPTCDEMQLSVPELRDRLIRTYAAYFWKTAKGKDANIPASQLAMKKDFIIITSYIGLEGTDPKKIADKFSDLGPRSHKKKKTSK